MKNLGMEFAIDAGIDPSHFPLCKGVTINHGMLDGNPLLIVHLDFFGKECGGFSINLPLAEKMIEHMLGNIKLLTALRIQKPSAFGRPS